MTSKFIQDTCLLLRHDGCKKGTFPVKGQGCKPSQGRMKQGKPGLKQGGGGNGWKTTAAIGAGTLAAGAIGAGVYANTNHGKRTIGKVEESVGRGINQAAKAWDEGVDAGANEARKLGVKESDVMKVTRQQKRVSNAATSLGNNFRQSGKLRQAQGRDPNKKKPDVKPNNDIKPFNRKKPSGGSPVPAGR
jgi:hypothetical protein